LGAVAASTDDFQTLDRLTKKADGGGSAPAQTNGATQLGLDAIHGTDSTPATCPTAAAPDFLKHQISYQRAQEIGPFKRIQQVHADVWARGPLTAFYVRNTLNEFVPSVRMAYLFGKSGPHGGGTCPVEKNWRECVADFAGREYANYVVETCSIDLDISTIPA